MKPENQRPPVGENFEKLEQALIHAGAMLSYPSTPALAPRVQQQLAAEQARRQSWLPRWGSPQRVVYAAIAALVLALVLLLAFPETREALAQFLGLRTVRIILLTPTPTPTATPTGTVTPLTTPTVTPTVKTFTQCCETTLDQARALARFKILLPPGEFPSKVYFQQIPNFGNAQQVILVFGDPSTPRFTLYEATNFLYGKMVSGGTMIEETSVNGERALWLSGAPHLLVYLDSNGNPEMETERPVNANTLAWESGDVTFRLETNLSNEQAARFAESLTEVGGTPTPTLTVTPLPTTVTTPVAQCCPTTLANARARTKFRILLPPSQLPSRVYFQDQILGPGSNGQQVILIFGEPISPRFTLFEAQFVVYEKVIGMVGKGAWPGTILHETEVNGQYALWISGTPHIVMYLNANGQPVVGSEHPVDANTLVWESDDVTFRLETKLSLEDAAHFAESLQ